jgi:hypothetical protein
MKILYSSSISCKFKGNVDHQYVKGTNISCEAALLPSALHLEQLVNPCRVEKAVQDPVTVTIQKQYSTNAQDVAKAVLLSAPHKL